MDVGLVEVVAVGLCCAIVLTEDVLEHIDAQPAGLIAGMIAGVLNEDSPLAVEFA